MVDLLAGEKNLDHLQPLVRHDYEYELAKLEHVLAAIIRNEG